MTKASKNGFRFSKARIAVSALFFFNGFLLGSWAPKIPFFLERMEITESVMGGLILLIGFGGLIILPITGFIMSKIGSQVPCRLFALASSFSLLMITLSPNLWIGAITLFLLGVAMIGLDIAMNSNVVAVEQHLTIKIMSSCHAWWSIGGIVGSFSGGLLIEFLGIYGHAIFVSCCCLTILLLAWPHLLADSPTKQEKENSFKLPKTPVVYLLGIMSFLSILPEGAIIDWSALYLIEELESPAISAGYAFSAFSLSMAILRLCGDKLRNHFGSVSIVRVSCCVGALGMLLSGLANSIPVALFGFAIAGLGIANLVPIIMSAAGNQSDISTHVGISTVGFMSMVGIMSAPAFLGFAAEFFSFSSLFATLPIFFIIIFISAPLVKSADTYRD